MILVVTEIVGGYKAPILGGQFLDVGAMRSIISRYLQAVRWWVNTAPVDCRLLEFVSDAT